MNIEGRNAVREALKSEQKILRLTVQSGLHDLDDIVSLAYSRGVKVNFTDRIKLNKMSITGKHQGIIAVVSDYEYSSVDEIRQYAHDRGEALFVLVLDGIEDPHNLGSILRVAECAGVHGVIIPKHRACAVTETAVKVSAGASNYVRVAMVTNVNDTIRELQNDFVSVYAADMDGESMYTSRLTGDIALVIGGEGGGVKALTKKLCDGVISIPMYGKINSLNASVATGIIVYEAVRQRDINR